MQSEVCTNRPIPSLQRGQAKSFAFTVMEKARAAGAFIVKAAHDTFWGGYSGYFQDPDGHLWEIVWNPQWSE